MELTEVVTSPPFSTFFFKVPLDQIHMKSPFEEIYYRIYRDSKNIILMKYFFSKVFIVNFVKKIVLF